MTVKGTLKVYKSTGKVDLNALTEWKHQCEIIYMKKKHSSNNEDSEIKIEFSESMVGKEKGGSRRYETQKGKKMKTRTAKNETHVKFKTDNRHRKETSLQEDEDTIVCRERIPSRVFSNIDERSEAFIRSRLEAMRRSHNIDSRMF